MNDTVAATAIAPVEKKPIKDVVALLEGMLEEARAGEIVAIGVAAVLSDGTPRKGKALPPRPFPSREADLYTVLGDLQFDLLEARAGRYMTGPVRSGED